jgi:hypothetical protein
VAKSRRRNPSRKDEKYLISERRLHMSTISIIGSGGMAMAVAGTWDIAMNVDIG